VSCVLATTGARADDTDGMYGRIDGDVELRAHAGAAFASGGPGLAASLTAVYLSSAGVYVHYTDALGSSAPEVTRSIAAGVHFAPLFVVRAFSNMEHGPASVDLLVDSFAFELGAVWSAPRARSFVETPGLEAALGVGVPLLGTASGPWLGVRAALRWRPQDFGPAAPPGILERGAVLSVTLGWHQLFRTHLVDPGDRLVP
jgi:hypothetical protein